jgi:hypothetical protein
VLLLHSTRRLLPASGVKKLGRQGQGSMAREVM